MALTDVSEVMNHKKYAKQISDLDERVTAIEEGGSIANEWKFRTVTKMINPGNFGTMTTDADGCLDTADLNLTPPDAPNKMVKILGYKVASGTQFGAKVDVQENLPVFLKQETTDLAPSRFIQFKRKDGTICSNMKVIEDGNSDLTEVIFDYTTSMVAMIVLEYLEKEVE